MVEEDKNDKIALTMTIDFYWNCKSKDWFKIVGGECLTFDQLTLRAPLCKNTMFCSLFQSDFHAYLCWCFILLVDCFIGNWLVFAIIYDESWYVEFLWRTLLIIAVG